MESNVKTPSERTLLATGARLKLGEITDSAVLNMINHDPGISTYTISKKLGYTLGRVDGSIARLMKRGSLGIQYVVKEGRISKELYPKGYVSEPRNQVKIGKDELDDPEKWEKRAYLYALDRITIGISPDLFDEWKKKALAVEDVEITKDEKDLVIKIPERLAEFYMWKNSKSDSTAIRDKLLVTLKTILPIRTQNEEERDEIENYLKEKHTQMLSQAFWGTLAQSFKFSSDTKQPEPPQGSGSPIPYIGR